MIIPMIVRANLTTENTEGTEKIVFWLGYDIAKR